MIKQCYISDKLVDELKHWHDFFNQISVKKTSYPIRSGNPTASTICAEILSAVRNNMTDIKVELIAKERYYKEIKMKGSLNLELDTIVSLEKVKGEKRNEIEFV